MLLTIIAGESGTGKTVSTCTFPKPMLILDFDAGMESVKHTRDKQGKLVVEDRDGLHVVPFYTNEVEPLHFYSADTKSKPSPPHTWRSPALIDEYNRIMLALSKKEKIDGRGPFVSLGIDSLTSAFRIWKNALMKMSGIASLRIQDYLALEGVLLDQFFPTLKALPLEYIILVTHTEIEKDEITGAIIEFPVGPSRNLGRNMGKAVDELWRQRCEGDNYLWRTRPSSFFNAKSGLNLPDPVVPATFKGLQAALAQMASYSRK